MISGPTAGEAATSGHGQARCPVQYLEPDGQQLHDHALSKKNFRPSLMRPIAALRAVFEIAGKRSVRIVGSSFGRDNQLLVGRQKGANGRLLLCHYQPTD